LYFLLQLYIVLSETIMSKPIRTSAASSQNLGRGSFRSKSRFWIDQNPRSRENVMRLALEELLGKPFPKARPTFLRNPATKRCLELDAYCESLRLGAEFSGAQHRVWPNSCHSTLAEFEKQQQRDRLKAELCTKHGVSLLIVPDSVGRAEMKEYVQSRLQEMQLLPMIEGIPNQEQIIATAITTDTTVGQSKLQHSTHDHAVTVANT
jgi:hypothetical protein